MSSEQYTSIIEESAIVKDFGEEDDVDNDQDEQINTESHIKDGSKSEEQINTESHIRDGSKSYALDEQQPHGGTKQPPILTGVEQVDEEDELKDDLSLSIIEIEQDTPVEVGGA